MPIAFVKLEVAFTLDYKGCFCQLQKVIALNPAKPIFALPETNLIACQPF